VIAIQKKEIRDFVELSNEYSCAELDYAILADCICKHLSEMQKFEKMHRRGMPDIAASIKMLQKKLIESIPEDLIAFSEDDKKLFMKEGE
jgi:hypothetical protein